MQSKAATVEEYLAELPPDRRDALNEVRRMFLKNIDRGIQEGMQYGMIGYYLPHSIYPDGYHCDPKQPLPFGGLASQKNYMSLYVFCNYVDDAQGQAFRNAWAKTGKKLDMGKSCIRFKKVEDLALDVLADSIRRMTVPKFIEFYETAIKSMNQRASKGPTKKTNAKKAVAAKSKQGASKSAKKSAKKLAPTTKKAAKAKKTIDR